MQSTKTKDKWMAQETAMKDDLSEFWGGDWGCDSEVGALKAVLLRRPGAEIENIKDPEDFRWQAVMEPELAHTQHDALAEFYRSQGIQVFYVEHMREDKANALFMRDNILMTPEGAIVGRQAMACRRGEERFAAETLAIQGVPIIKTISGKGIFETACCLWVDARTVILGSGNRANYEGCRQMEESLESAGVENFIYLQIPYGYAHIDSIVSFIDAETAVIDPDHISWDAWTELKKLGLCLWEAPSPEETRNLALNFVTLEPKKVLMASGFPQTKTFLEKHNIHVHEIDVSELRKGWGSLHCMTAVLKRELIGSIR